MRSKIVSKSLLLLSGVYALYLVKSALGINISDRYSAWEFVKAPVKSFIYK